MTPYEHGFLTKCAEAGLTTGQSIELMEKSAAIGRFLSRAGRLGGKLLTRKWVMLPAAAYAGYRMFKDNQDPYQTRSSSLRDLMDRRNQVAAKENLQFSDQELPGNLFSRTWDRMTMGREDFHKKYTDIVEQQIAQARKAKARADELNGKILVPETSKPSSPVAPATDSSNAEGGSPVAF